ncbi:shootin-1-like isoform X1 [Tachysurus fulvidraco]|uniref:shootin-1-like isoform X1 n=1 Tax=Tachysurus fulvidraco TaxID=1234273 RepID=UPI001FEE6530|nr:shootin-1-like isoform X1 [Tachysurus fulvidraco]
MHLFFKYFSFRVLEKDVRQQAVSEMMERIKKGIQLRPVGQTVNKARPQQRERMPSGSAIQELKGILSTVRRPSPCPSPPARPSSPDAQSELQKVLMKRRGVLETANDNTVSAQPFPSSVLDMTRVKITPTTSAEKSVIKDKTQH